MKFFIIHDIWRHWHWLDLFRYPGNTLSLNKALNKSHIFPSCTLSTYLNMFKYQCKLYANKSYIMLENNTLYKIYKMYIKMFGLRWPTGSSEIPTGFPATCRPFWPSYLPVTSLACPWGGPHVIWGQLCWLWPNLFIHRARYRWTQRSVDFTCPSSVACPPCWLTAPSPPHGPSLCPCQSTQIHLPRRVSLHA